MTQPKIHLRPLRAHDLDAIMQLHRELGVLAAAPVGDDAPHHQADDELAHGGDRCDQMRCGNCLGTTGAPSRIPERRSGSGRSRTLPQSSRRCEIC